MQLHPAAMEFHPEASAGYLANQMARLFAAALTRRIRPLGLAPAQFMTLLALWEADEDADGADAGPGPTQADLVARLNVEQATIANTLQRMERDGLIARHVDAEDGRVRRIVPTAKARALRAPATAAAAAVNAAALGPLTAEERAQFLGMMRRVIAGMRDGG